RHHSLNLEQLDRQAATQRDRCAVNSRYDRSGAGHLGRMTLREGPPYSRRPTGFRRPTVGTHRSKGGGAGPRRNGRRSGGRMSQREVQSFDDDPSLTPSLLEQAVAVCDAFEAAWRDGEAPRIEDHLRGQPESVRPVLLRELLAVELELRARFGE